MNYGIQEYYDELYRVFADQNVLLSTTQLVMLGDCLRSLMAGENITYKLEQLFTAVQNVPKVADLLEHYMHKYNSFVEEDNIDEDDPKEDKRYEYKSITQPQPQSEQTIITQKQQIPQLSSKRRFYLRSR